jgi:thiosulfate/3-mercaptopyruvate sulfurtransferase
MAFRTLIAAEQLAAHIADPSWRVFDCRHDLSQPDSGARAYRDAHIPGAQFLHLDRDLSGPQTGNNGRHPLPDPAALAAKLAACGVANATQVVAYDDSGGMYAVRLWWLLRWLGHDDVAVLDGGLAAWRNAGYGVTAEVPVVQPAVFDWRLRDESVDVGFLLAHLKDPRVLLIDSRGADRFRGENETIDPVAGHIPGAVNRPFRNNLNSGGRFRPAEELRAEFERLLGKHPAEEVVAYCGSGVSACHNLLALEVAGFHGARLYAGSWSEWCSDRARPIATGV